MASLPQSLWGWNQQDCSSGSPETQLVPIEGMSKGAKKERGSADPSFSDIDFENMLQQHISASMRDMAERKGYLFDMVDKA